MSKTQPPAQQRASVILQVRSGQITASQGARLLGLSRKTYYQWEKRGLEAMISALEEQAPGRPRQQSQPETAALREQIAQLEAKLRAAEATAEVRAALIAMRQTPEKRSVKKKKLRSSIC